MKAEASRSGMDWWVACLVSVFSGADAPPLDSHLPGAPSGGNPIERLPSRCLPRYRPGPSRTLSV